MCGPFLYVHAKFATLRYGIIDDFCGANLMNAAAALAVSDGARQFAPHSAAAGPCAIRMLTYADLRADASLLAEWDVLAAAASESNPFAERWYMEAALAALGSDNVRIAAIQDDALIGIMLLIAQSRYAGLPLPHVQNWLNHNAFLGTPLVRKNAERQFWAALLRHFDETPDSGLFLHLNALTVDGPVVAALEDVCSDDKRRFAMVHCEERALLERGLSPDAYWETNVRGKKRKELRRQHKRLAEEGALTFERSDGSVALDRWIDDFLALEMAGWKGQNGSALDCADDTRALFRAALHGAAAAGKLELLAHYLDGRPIAMLVNFVTPPAAFSFKTAFDENFARYSPGVLLQFENLALLGRDGIDYCDSCAAQDHPMIDSLWSGRRMIGRYSVAIGGKAKRAAFAALLTAEKTKAKFKGRTKT
jgi:CelD/BcsL family acetyltransferase involved in cellulose biosynthesis